MKQKKKTLKKKQKNNVLPNKVFVPKTNQEIISYMFKEVDERTGIFRIDEDTYSICIEYSDVSFAKANDEEAENIFFKWLEYLHSFREDTHIQVINAGTPIKTEKYKEKFIFEKEHLKSEKQIQIADELEETPENIESLYHCIKDHFTLENKDIYKLYKDCN